MIRCCFLVAIGLLLWPDCCQAQETKKDAKSEQGVVRIEVQGKLSITGSADALLGREECNPRYRSESR